MDILQTMQIWYLVIQSKSNQKITILVPLNYKLAFPLDSYGINITKTPATTCNPPLT